MQSEQQAGALPAGPWRATAVEWKAIAKRYREMWSEAIERGCRQRDFWMDQARTAEFQLSITEQTADSWAARARKATALQQQQAAAWAEERAAYREALEFYANDANWLPDSTNTDRYSRVAVDDGAKAQAALARAGRATAGGA